MKNSRKSKKISSRKPRRKASRKPRRKASRKPKFKVGEKNELSEKFKLNTCITKCEKCSSLQKRVLSSKNCYASKKECEVELKKGFKGTGKPTAKTKLIWKYTKFKRALQQINKFKVPLIKKIRAPLVSGDRAVFDMVDINKVTVLINAAQEMQLVPTGSVDHSEPPNYSRARGHRPVHSNQNLLRDLWKYNILMHHADGNKNNTSSYANKYGQEVEVKNLANILKKRFLQSYGVKLTETYIGAERKRLSEIFGLRRLLTNTTIPCLNLKTIFFQASGRSKSLADALGSKEKNEAIEVRIKKLSDKYPFLDKGIKRWLRETALNIEIPNLSFLDLSRAQFPKADFSHVPGMVTIMYSNLRGVNFKNADLRNVSFSCSDLRDANLRGADLRGADLSNTKLRGANLQGADLSNTKLRGADLSNTKLRGAQLSELEPYLQGADLYYVKLQGADLRDAKLQGADLRDAKLQGADLRDAKLRGADLQHADLQHADLQHADLRDASLFDADLRGADLRGADLSNTKLNYADLRGADLRGADLQHAELYYAKLQGADLRGADFRIKLAVKAILRGAKLRGANLRGANLQGANLQGAELYYAKLRGAKLRGDYEQKVSLIERITVDEKGRVKKTLTLVPRRTSYS